MADYYFGRAEQVAGEAGNLSCLWEIEIDVTNAAGKIKAIKVPIAAAPVTARTTTSGSVALPHAK